MTDAVKWTSRPSFRPLMVGAVLAGGLGVGLCSLVSPIFQGVINATSDLVYWSDGAILGIYRFSQAAVFIPLAIVGLKAIQNASIRYELDAGRLLYHHGILFRRHDQIALQRVRDFRVYRSLLDMTMGLGKVHIISRDETHPELTIGPLKDPMGVEKLLREAVIGEQEKLGYREFEAT